MLNAVLLRAQVSCCDMANLSAPADQGMAALEDEFVAMFRAEWALFNQMRGRPAAELRTVAIVDEAPQSQYLAPEFALFADLFKRHGIEAVVTDAANLQVRGGVLYSGTTPIDLVYNRLTDFDFSAPQHAALAQAHVGNLAAVTPPPMGTRLAGQQTASGDFGPAQRAGGLGRIGR